MQVLQLDPDDDIVSICDRLDWSDARQLLLVLPQEDGVLESGVDLARLRRYADRQRKELGLVTANSTIARQAKSLGLPAFASIEEGLTRRKGWWRGRRRTEQIGLPPGGISQWDPASVQPKQADSANEVRISGRHWLLRYAIIILFFTTVALIFVAVVYTLPRASISLKPAVAPMQAMVQVVADPSLDVTDLKGSRIPARLVSVDLTWQAEEETTGSEVVPLTPASGRVLFRNLTEEEIEMPVGTLVSTTNADQAFQTVAPLTIAGVLSSTAEVDVVALEAGPQNNVEAEAISRIGGPFAELVTVTNPEPLSGGDVSEVATVTGEDRERLRSQVLQFLQAVAVAEMETTLSEREFLARDSIRVVTVERETYSQQVGDRSDSVRLKLEARLQGTAIDLTEAAGLAYDSLAGQVGEGFNLIVDSITYHQNEVLEADKDGRVVFLMHSEGLVAADFELETLVVTISGQTPEVATAYLYEVLPLRDVPGIDVWPQWFKRLPYKSNRIDVAIITGD